MIVNIIAGSPFDFSLVERYPADFTIGVDYGAYRVVEHKLPLDLALGDFDSINANQFIKLINNTPKINKFNKVKNETDTEIALQYALDLNPDIIQIFGVTGKRIDHFLNVLNLFHKILQKNVELILFDEYNKIYIRKPGTYPIKKSDYQYISFFAYHKDVVQLTLKNFKYELNDYLLTTQDTLCVSNEILSDYGEVSFKEGILLIVESHD